jgi:hypothetical protein
VADRPERRAADLADALGDRVGHGEQLVRLLVEHQVVVAEVRAAQVPVEVLRLQVQREDVGEDAVHRAGDVTRGLRRQVGRRGEGRALAVLRCLRAAGGGGFHDLSSGQFGSFPQPS